MSTFVAQAPKRHVHTVADYYRMAAAGILRPDERTELIEGEIIDMAPIGSRHASVVTKLALELQRVVNDRATVRVQNPVRLSDLSEPQPDLALLRPRADFYRDAHPGPADILLIIEVADTSLDYDRNTKLPLYARHGVPEVWLVDLVASTVERFLDPAQAAYRRRDVLSAAAAPSLLPDCTIRLEAF